MAAKKQFTTVTGLKRLAGSAVALSAILVSVACDDGEDVVSVVTTSTEKPADENAGDEAIDPRKAEELAYTYDAMNRRDPFKTYFDELVLVEAEAENLTELQRIDLDKLKLIAVVTGTATPMAMVEDGTGRGHTIKIGTLVGKRFGQVKQIKRGEVVIQEEFRDFTGKRIPVLKALKIEEEENPLSNKKK
jgi:type IV pilus assembly protein PilP